MGIAVEPDLVILLLMVRRVTFVVDFGFFILILGKSWGSKAFL